MKASRILAVGIVMAISLFWLNTLHAGPPLWPINRGEICFNNTGPGPGAGEFVSMAVLHTIGNHYIVHGYVIEVSGNKTLFNGNAIVDEDLILMHVSSSGSTTADEVHGFVGRVELDSSTLEGVVVGIGLHCSGNPADDDCDFGYDGYQYLEPTPCP